MSQDDNNTELTEQETITSAEVTEAKAEETVEVETDVTSAEEPQAALSVEATDKGPGQHYLDAFGDQGGIWFAQGVDFGDAQELFNKSLLDQIAELRQDNEALRQRLSAAMAEGESIVPQTARQTDESKPKRSLKDYAFKGTAMPKL